jgi:hypothetical protein
MKRSMGMRCLVLAAAALPLAAADVQAQEGYYDGAGNWVEIVPPPPGYYAEPPPGYYEAPPDYYEPPPEYYEPPTAYAEPPPTWGRRVLLPPGDIPGGRPLRPLRRDELPPEWRDDPGAVRIAPDGQALVPPEEVLRRPAERVLRERRDAERAPEFDRPPPPGLEPPPDEGPVVREALPGIEPLPEDGPAVREAPEMRYAEPEGGDWDRAVAALTAYAPAKKAAVALQDSFDRLAAVKAANVWLVSSSAQPATAATIRALDKLLGIEATEETTALPGAGTEVKKPAAKGADAFRGAIERIGDYASLKSDVRRVGDEEKAAVEQEAEKLLSDGGKVILDRDEIAGLDLYLGFGDTEPEVAVRTRPDASATE